MPLPGRKRFGLAREEAVTLGERADRAFDQYDSREPSPQNAIDALPGWLSAFPPPLSVAAGALAFYADPRIAWCLELFGPLAGCSVLELGPLDGGHTYMLEQAGASSIDAIEANKTAYLRCLVFKEIAGLKVARFHLGDFVKWLDGDRAYDLIVASGVLYHMRDPLHLLEQLARAGKAIFLWTHCLTDEARARIDPGRSVFSEDETRLFRGRPVRLYRRGYRDANTDQSFCGGMYDDHRWLHRDDLLTVLTLLGFDDVTIGMDQPDHVNGPALAIFARRSNISAG
jgi:protein-L-isoaspartate O-methyltransferase